MLKGQLKRTLEKVTDQGTDKEYPFDVGGHLEDYGEFLGPEGIGVAGEVERLEHIHIDQQYSNYPNCNRETKRSEHARQFNPEWYELDPVLVDIWNSKGSAINRHLTKHELLAEGQLTRRQIESMPDTVYLGENNERDYEWDDDGYLDRETPPSGATELPFRVCKEHIVRLPDGRVGKMDDSEVQKCYCLGKKLLDGNQMP